MGVLPSKSPPDVTPKILLSRREVVAFDLQTQTERHPHGQAKENV